MEFNDKIKKVATHVNQNEGLIFEKSSPGKKAYKLPPLDVPEVDAEALLGEHAREDLGNMPEVSEIEIIRHFTRMSTWNYAVDYGMYPLGSCTMKYNARVNEYVARLEGLAQAHPYQPERISQGALRIMKMLRDQLMEITGMDAITLQPAAGAHGELTGILLIRAYLESQGNPRKKILVPDSAHGTNPATAATAGYAVENLKSNASGMVDIASLVAQVNDDVAALMLTNPNTLGIFEQEIHKIADVLHDKGALLYMDGANMNALVGKGAPRRLRHRRDAPQPAQDVLHAARRRRTRLRPGRLQEDPRTVPAHAGRCRARRRHAGLRLQPPAIHRTRAHVLRQLRHARARAGLHHGQRPRRPSPDHRRRGAQRQLHSQEAGRHLRAAIQDPTMHEVVFSDHLQTRKGVKTGDIAKRLIDYGFHPYTVSFPLVVHGA